MRIHCHGLSHGHETSFPFQWTQLIHVRLPALHVLCRVHWKFVKFAMVCPEKNGPDSKAAVGSRTLSAEASAEAAAEAGSAPEDTWGY